MRLPILVLLLLAANVHAQSLGDIARAERKRREQVEPSKVIVKVGEKKPEEIPSTPPPKATAPLELQVQEAEVKDDEHFEQEFQNERLALLKKRSALLSKLGEVIRDRDAVHQIELELQQVQQRAAQLKVERLSKLEERKREGQEIGDRR